MKIINIEYYIFEVKNNLLPLINTSLITTEMWSQMFTFF